jgi:plasmid stabilization system protein ParE
MKSYRLHFSPEAEADLSEVFHYIAYELKSPATAVKYFDGMLDTISRLAWLGGSFAVSERAYIQKLYGPGARTVSYKKMTVVYNVIGDVVLIRRVMASSMVL